MGVRLPSVFATVANAIALSGATETVAVTLPPVSQPLDGAVILLYWWVMASAATGATLGAFRIRRGAAGGGTQLGIVGWQDFSFVPGYTGVRSGVYADVPGVVANQQYQLTVQMNGQSGASQILDGCMVAMVL